MTSSSVSTTLSPTLALQCEADSKADTANPKPSLERTGRWLERKHQVDLNRYREAGIGANHRHVPCSHIDSAFKRLGRARS